MPDRHEPGTAEQRRAKVVLTAHLHVARVQPHADADLADVGPILRANSLLTQEGGANPVAGLAEGRVDPVTNRLEDDAAAGFDRRAQQVVVSAHGVAHRVRVLLESPGATLDVRKKKGDGTGGQHEERGYASAVGRLGIPDLTPAVVIVKFRCLIALRLPRVDRQRQIHSRFLNQKRIASHTAPG